MSGSPLAFRPPVEQELKFKSEWHGINKDNSYCHNNSSTSSRLRRHSGSYLRSFREDFRPHFVISSAASSPAHLFKDEIDPSTYSFTTALKALQVRTECEATVEGIALSSKWNEAERYICNPLSGQVPVQCLSAKTLSARSFRSYTNTVFPAMSTTTATHPSIDKPLHNNITNAKSIIPPQGEEGKVLESRRRDEGIQRAVDDEVVSSYNNINDNSESPAISTPSIQDRIIRRHTCDEDNTTEDGDTPNSSSGDNNNNNTQISDSTTIFKPVYSQVKVTVTREGGETKKRIKEDRKKKKKPGQICDNGQHNNSGCFFSWRSCLWMKRRQRGKHKLHPSHNLPNHPIQ